MKKVMFITFVMSAFSFGAVNLTAGTRAQELNVVSAVVQPIEIESRVFGGNETVIGSEVFAVVRFPNECSVPKSSDIVVVQAFSDAGNGSTTARLTVFSTDKKFCNRIYLPVDVTISLGKGKFSSLSNVVVNGVRAIAPLN